MVTRQDQQGLLWETLGVNRNRSRAKKSPEGELYGSWAVASLIDYPAFKKTIDTVAFKIVLYFLNIQNKIRKIIKYLNM
jgi:hypothetical protein